MLPSSELWITSRYDDLSIISKFLQLISYLNDIKNEDKSYQADYALEITLINFIQSFKLHALGDGRIRDLADTAYEEAKGKRKSRDNSSPLDGGETDEENQQVVSLYNQMDRAAQRSHDSLA